MSFAGDATRSTSVVDEALTRGAAVASLAGIAAIHALQLPEAFRDAGYLGGLFVAAAVASVVLAAVIARMADSRAVDAAGALAGLILLGYLISRIFGLPSFTDDVGEWTEPLGLLSMVAEGLLICLAAVSHVRVPSAAGRPAGWPGRMGGSRPYTSAG